MDIDLDRDLARARGLTTAPLKRGGAKDRKVSVSDSLLLLDDATAMVGDMVDAAESVGHTTGTSTKGSTSTDPEPVIPRGDVFPKGTTASEETRRGAEKVRWG